MNIVEDKCPACISSDDGCAQCDFTGIRKLIPTSDTYNVTLRNGRQVSIKDVSDKVLAQLCRKKLKNLKRHIFELIHLQKECESRDYDGGDLGKLEMMSGYNIFQLTRYATLISAHNYNGIYSDKVNIIDGNREEPDGGDGDEV